jgi:hypothetical protein
MNREAPSSGKETGEEFAGWLIAGEAPRKGIFPGTVAGEQPELPERMVLTAKRLLDLKD